MHRNSTLAGMAVIQAVDAALCVRPTPTIAQCLDDVHYPRNGRWIFPVVKSASAAGLVGGIRYPWLARLTLIMLTLYFVLAVGSHARVRDFGRNAALASGLLALYVTLAAREIARSE